MCGEEEEVFGVKSECSVADGHSENILIPGVAKADSSLRETDMLL